MKILFSLSALCFLVSCMPKFATDEEKKQAITAADFDTAIIARGAEYGALKDFLVKYSDTIIAYRNSKNVVVNVGAGGKNNDTVTEKQSCYTFFQGNSQFDITNVPDFLKPRLDSIYKIIGEQNIRHFEICLDKRVIINARMEKKDHGLYVKHELIWNPGDFENYPDCKDTIINKDYIYHISLEESHGH